MADLLSIDHQYRNLLIDIIGKLDKKQQDYCVSFDIDPKKNTLQLVGGHAPEYIQAHIPLAENHQLKKKRFTLDGAYFSQLPNYSGKDNAIELTLNNDDGSHPFVGITTKNDKFLGCNTNPFYPAHEAFIEETQQHAFKSGRVADIQRLLLEVDTYKPFQYVEIDKDNNEIRVQNDNNQQIHDIPDNVPVPLPLVLTQEATYRLKEICENTKDDTVKIAAHGENITFKTSDTTMTLSLAGIEEFHKNKPQKYEQVASMIVDINRLHNEIHHFYTQYPKIKRANKSHLLIEPTQLYIVNIVDDYRFIMPISAKGISVAENQLYLLHLKDIEAVRIKDLTTSDQLKIAILKGPQGDYKLGFYKAGDLKFPYASVPVDPAPSEMDDAMAVKQKAQESKNSNHVEESGDPQDDLFGFEDV